MSGVNGTNGVNAASSLYSTSEVSASNSSSEIGTIQMVSEDSKSEETQKANKAKQTLENDINKGNAIYNQTNWFGNFIAAVEDDKMGDFVIIKGLPNDITLGEIKVKYNLPDGSLKHMISSGGGNFNTYNPPTNSDGGYVRIYSDDFAEALGISTRELKGMFPDKQFSPWYKLGTKE